MNDADLNGCMESVKDALIAHGFDPLPAEILGWIRYQCSIWEEPSMIALDIRRSLAWELFLQGAELHWNGLCPDDWSAARKIWVKHFPNEALAVQEIERFFENRLGTRKAGPSP